MKRKTIKFIKRKLASAAPAIRFPGIHREGYRILQREVKRLPKDSVVIDLGTGKLNNNSATKILTSLFAKIL